jgi:hypothetical protein
MPFVKVFIQERKLLGARYGTLLLTDVCLVGARDRLTYSMFHENRFEHFLRALTRCFRVCSIAGPAPSAAF